MSTSSVLPSRLNCIGLGLTLGIMVFGSDVLSAPLNWPEGTYKYITVDQTVSDALAELGRNIGVPVRVSSQVKGRLGPGLPQGTAREFLDWVCQRYGLAWHFDGAAVNIVAEAEIRTELVKVQDRKMGDLKTRLAKLGVVDERFGMNISDEDRTISISGPPTYIDQIKAALGALEGPKVRGGVVRVFRGKQSEIQSVSSGQTKADGI